MVLGVIIYLLAISLFTFLLMSYDKKKAIKHKRRVPEAAFMFFTLIGGGLGVIFGMYAFRHKTQKPLFTVLVPLIVVFQLIFFGFVILC